MIGKEDVDNKRTGHYEHIKWPNVTVTRLLEIRIFYFQCCSTINKSFPKSKLLPKVVTQIPFFQDLAQKPLLPGSLI